MNSPLLSVNRDIFAPAGPFITVVGHGVNVAGVMGAGFAKIISDGFPEVKKAYQVACSNGTLTPGKTQLVQSSRNGVYIANIASQDNPGPYARLEWLQFGLEDMYNKIKPLAVNNLISVRLPLIGAGIGGLDPIEAADVIFNVASKPWVNVSTELCLLSTDRHSGRVEAHYRRRFTL